MDLGEMGVLVVSHGGLARELVLAAETILGGEQERLRSHSMDWEDDVDETRDELRRTLGELGMPAGTLILADMFGGTPTNVSLSLVKEERVQVVCGVNLPMVLKALSLEEARDLSDAARQVAEMGREGVCVAEDLLRKDA